MRISLNEEKARIIRIAYMSFMGVNIISLILSQVRTGQDLVVFGTIASGVAFGTYCCFFFLNLKLLFKYKWLFAGNICFILSNLSFVTLALTLELRGIMELILVVFTIILFIVVSDKTLKILIKRYNPELPPI
jgi:hypothetical protein